MKHICEIHPAGRHQQGLTMISWLVVIVFLLFQAVIAMNVIPVYLTDASIKSIMEELPNDAKAREATPKQLKILVLRRLNVNSVYAVTPDDVSVQRGRGENIVTIDYEPRGKLIGNLEYIVSFHHEARVPNR